ncbi:MAG TPA: hypothetical protein VK481_03030, partial [Gemmatimonadaceae bacterium]|nr:hypothetical protein [Gemmatimonadaceae bacterium]
EAATAFVTMMRKVASGIQRSPMPPANGSEPVPAPPDNKAAPATPENKIDAAPSAPSAAGVIPPKPPERQP